MIKQIHNVDDLSEVGVGAAIYLKKGDQCSVEVLLASVHHGISVSGVSPEYLFNDGFEMFRIPPLEEMLEVGEVVGEALDKAFQLGQNYFYQADHDFISQNKKADKTMEVFKELKRDVSKLSQPGRR